jgi:flagellar capping protein FliD
MQSLNDYLKKTAGPGGVFQTEKDGATAEIARLSSRIASKNEMLAQRQQRLQAQFTAMESALARLNAQGASMMSSLGIAPSSSSSSSAG